MSSKKKNPDDDLFREAMADVRPLPADGRIEPVRPRPPARAVQQARDDREALQEMLQRIDLDAAETGEELLWLKPGYQPRVLRRLRRGHYAITDTIDLHYMDVPTARQVLLDFIERSLRDNRACIRIVHGKGLRSRGTPVLKALTKRVLWKHPRVIAFASCRAVDGGTGATLALLSANPARPR
ncbi:MAG: Smr/MutS family protein [Xanthomonadales bacterium]